VPAKFDERQYAVRSNVQGSVTGPVEIVDDLTEIRMGLNQRWQTKRGLPGQERIIDWVVLDVSAVLFPEPNRDNFGSELGLIDYDFQWHVGDRLTLLSDGFYDVFDSGLHQTTFGAFLNRPQFGNVYVGYRSTEGPFTSSLLAGSLSYRMSESGFATAGASWDLGPTGNIGQNVNVTRIGESFLIKWASISTSAATTSALPSWWSRGFLSSSRLGRVGGVQIPPAGAHGGWGVTRVGLNLRVCAATSGLQRGLRTAIRPVATPTARTASRGEQQSASGMWAAPRNICGTSATNAAMAPKANPRRAAASFSSNTSRPVCHGEIRWRGGAPVSLRRSKMLRSWTAARPNVPKTRPRAPSSGTR
jgi:hypothetical protein